MSCIAVINLIAFIINIACVANGLANHAILFIALSNMFITTGIKNFFGDVKLISMRNMNNAATCSNFDDKSEL